MITGWISAVLAAVFGGLAVRDLRARDADLVFLALRKTEQPILYWALVAFEAVFALLCTIVALAAFFYLSDCDENGVCTVTIPARNPAP